ncbi:MAG: hypothetical protein J6W53_08060 [Candidatus Methanomethylophilaceae archaeon]|nr:hypothetical protein [Candidatus Methanomethylophilaceae archaeon]
MCDVFQDKFDHGLTVGKAEGIEIGKAEGIEIGKGIGKVEAYATVAVSLVRKMGMSVEEVLSVLDIPDDLRPEVTSEVERRLSS